MFRYQNFFSLTPSLFEDLYASTNIAWNALKEISNLMHGYCHKIEIPILEGVILINRELVSIGKNTQIDPFVMIEGPCIIGNNCHIKHGAYIRSNTIIADHCIIGHGCEIKGSLLHPHATIAHLCYVGDSIIGSYTNVSAGVKCANLRLDKKEVALRVGAQKIPTGLFKFGALIADHVLIGCNSVLNPGTVIGKNSVVYPLCNPGGFISENSIVKSNSVMSIASDPSSRLNE